MPGQKSVLMVINDKDRFWTHRVPLARAILKKGWELSLTMPGAPADYRMDEMGIRAYDLPDHHNGLNPVEHIRILRTLRRLIKTTRPDVINAVTIRHSFYVGLAARSLGYGNLIFTIAGLGSLFAKGRKARILRFFVVPVLKLALSHNRARFIFQNTDDRNMMVKTGVAREEQTVLIKSSGVDLKQFQVKPEPETDKPVVLFCSRLIREKGVAEFVEAARILKSRGSPARFLVAGDVYTKNLHSISRGQMDNWHKEGVIEWLGEVQNEKMPELYEKAAVFSLPSYYREGVPKAALEAAASGRPVITTDLPGCRETIIPGKTGLFVESRNAEDLAEKIEELLQDPRKRHVMGQAGRAFVEKEFSVESVVDRTLEVYNYYLEQRADKTMRQDNVKPLILLGLNEVNFHYIQAYARQGHLPNFAGLFEKVPVTQTTSEKAYRELEPWIQWVSIQTGKPLSEHKIFRLGDVTEADITQIWEHLEDKYDIKVAACSPMNAANRAKDPAFFIPDPWTKTKATGDWLMRRLGEAVADVVNENATGGSRISSYVFVLLGVFRYSLIQRPAIILEILRALPSHFQKAVLLDQLLTDMFVYHWKKGTPRFSSLFLNGCAHIQHHYLFNSAQYKGKNKNPDWYMDDQTDPILEGYKGYDKIIGRLLDLPNKPRILIATGLHQTPVKKPVFYWRLRDHGEFLHKIGIDFKEVQPRMSRDFMVTFSSQASCDYAEKILKACTDQNGKSLFGELENRETSLFVTLTYDEEITDDFVLKYPEGEIRYFKEMVAFVALKNGEHDGEGYLLDTDGRIDAKKSVPVTDIFRIMDEHFSQAKSQKQKKKAA